MNCEMTEKVSLMIDGELALTEMDALVEHLAVCASCRQAQKDFLRLRHQLVAYEVQPDPAQQQRALNRILGAQAAPLWQRTIALPAPVFALLLCLLVGLSGWLVAQRAIQPAKGPSDGRRVIVPPPNETAAPTAFDLSRFDRGARAVIYAAKRAERGQR